jgi:uncharacterized protein (DUF2141 family)
MFVKTLNKMKTKILIASLTVLIIFFSANMFAQGKLEVTVKNIKQTKGTIRVGLFTNEDNFLKKAIDGKIVKADATQVTVIFENLKNGDYAVSVIHDENENGELDKNMVGIPKEGFAFSNNVMGSFGPPSFDKAKISVKEKKEVQALDLIYY